MAATYVDQSAPTSNFGKSSDIRVHSGMPSAESILSAYSWMPGELEGPTAAAAALAHAQKVGDKNAVTSRQPRPGSVQIRNGLLKFSVTVEPQRIESAKLRLCATSSSASGGDFSVVDDGFWDEDTVTWPGPGKDGAVFASLGPVVAGRCYEVDVSDIVRRDGIYSFRITSLTPTDVRYASREANPHLQPILIITTSEVALN